MEYTAVHAGWGQLDASLDDLGCGRSVHHVKGLELACPECRGRVFARISPHRARHFYPQVRPHDCALANESPEHHRPGRRHWRVRPTARHRGRLSPYAACTAAIARVACGCTNRSRE
jgi:DNA-directed RNA polymerase subunit RPC12/RpoP